jgi:hypothetical protein
MSVTFSYQAYYGNNGEVLGGRASLANGFAFVRSHSNSQPGLPAYVQAQRLASKGLLANQSIEEELKARRIFLFSIYVLDSQPLPLSEEQKKNMRSATQDFGSWSSVIIIVEEDDEEDDDEDHPNGDDFSIVDIYPALFRKPAKEDDEQENNGEHNPNQPLLDPLADALSPN